MVTQCSIMDIDQATGNSVELVRCLRCSDPNPYKYRQARAETSYDFHPVHIITHVPRQTIEENMRLVFKTGEDFRIHSINKWPMVNSKYLEIVLQGEGNA